MGEDGGIDGLSPRELEIAQAYAGGATYREVAGRLFIAPATVRTHLSTIYRKLNVSSKIGLFRALETGGVPGLCPQKGASTIAFPERPSIAVLPFISMSGDSEQELVADGLTEDVIARLSQLRDLLVIARTSTFSFKGRAMRAQDIASDLGAKFLLEGSVRTAGKRIRIIAQLIDGQGGAHLWAERYDRDLTEILDVQDEIAHAIAVAMQVRLLDGEVVESDAGWTKNFDAWEKFHQGIMAHLTYTAEGGLRARRLFEEALDHDPHFIDARVYLAWTHWQDARSGYSPDRWAALSRCRRLVAELKAKGAATANAKHIEAATLLLEHRYEEALDVSIEAVSMGPCKIFGYTPAAVVNTYCGNPRTAVDLLRTTMRVFPYTPNDTVYNLAFLFSSVGEQRIAIKCAKDYLQRVPTDLYAYIVMAKAYVFAGDITEARATIGEFSKLYPTFKIHDLIAHEPYHDARELKLLVEACREAGLPE